MLGSGSARSIDATRPGLKRAAEIKYDAKGTSKYQLNSYQENIPSTLGLQQLLQYGSGGLGRPDRVARSDDPNHTHNCRRRSPPLRAASQAQGPQAAAAEPAKDIILPIAGQDGPRILFYIYHWRQSIHVLRLAVVVALQTRSFLFEHAVVGRILNGADECGKHTWAGGPSV